jgi:hypothetical protein
VPVEAAVYIDTLNPSNPTGAEKAGQGDDHLRTIKRVLQSTFPAIAGAVTLTHAILNALPARIKVFEDSFTVSGVVKLAAALDANSLKITGLADPVSAQDADTKAARNAAIAALFPVGAIYLAAVATNPATLLGFGTWTARSQGLFLAGVGTGTDAGSVSKTLASGVNAGRYQTVLTDDNLPAHDFLTDAFISVSSDDKLLPAGTAKGIVTAGVTGSATAVGTAPPSFAVYVWERTA